MLGWENTPIQTQEGCRRQLLKGLPTPPPEKEKKEHPNNPRRFYSNPGFSPDAPDISSKPATLKPQNYGKPL